MKYARVYGVALIVFLGSVGRSTADPILIQSGSLTAEFNSAPLFISLVGADRGFTFESWLSRSQARFDPDGDLRQPGTTVGVGGQWSTGSFGETTVTLDGRTFPEGEQRVGGMQLRDPKAYFVLDGPPAGPLPTGAAGDVFTMDAPFTFSGFFDYLVDPSLSTGEFVWNRNALIGQGTASLTYVGQAMGSPEQTFFTWRFRSAAYQFESGSTPPVPEPWSVLLLGSGLVGLAARIRGRNKRTTSARL